MGSVPWLKYVLYYFDQVQKFWPAEEADKFSFDLWWILKNSDFLAVTRYLNTWSKWYSMTKSLKLSDLSHVSQ